MDEVSILSRIRQKYQGKIPVDQKMGRFDPLSRVPKKWARSHPSDFSRNFFSSPHISTITVDK